MGILNEIQAATLDSSANLGSVLLKLRFLASRLGSSPLADWVKFESEGYPTDVAIPDYRKVNVSYVGTFFGAYGASITNAPIPPYLIEKFAGKKWNQYEVRNSIAAVEELALSSGAIGVSNQNLVLILQNKIYKGYACNSVNGTVDKVAIKEIVQTVRNRVLELTIEIEKEIPGAADVLVAGPAPKIADKEKMTKIVNQTVYGNVTQVTAADNSTINVNIQQGEISSMVKSLVDAGLPQGAADEIAHIVAAEKPEAPDRPLGIKATEWLSKNLKHAASRGWGIGVSALSKVVEEAALRYYGLK